MWAAYDAYVIAKRINRGVKHEEIKQMAIQHEKIEDDKDIPEVYIR